MLEQQIKTKYVYKIYDIQRQQLIKQIKFHRPVLKIDIYDMLADNYDFYYVELFKRNGNLDDFYNHMDSILEITLKII